MKLGEVAHITQTECTEGKTLSGDFFASFDGLEIKDGCVLRSPVGFGTTAKKARVALAENISGQLVVTGSFREDRNEFEIPEVKA